MLPRRLATWLSATRNTLAGMEAVKRGMVSRLKMPWRKSQNITHWVLIELI